MGWRSTCVRDEWPLSLRCAVAPHDCCPLDCGKDRGFDRNAPLCCRSYGALPCPKRCAWADIWENGEAIFGAILFVVLFAKTARAGGVGERAVQWGAAADTDVEACAASAAAARPSSKLSSPSSLNQSSSAIRGQTSLGLQSPASHMIVLLRIFKRFIPQ